MELGVSLPGNFKYPKVRFVSCNASIIFLVLGSVLKFFHDPSG
jgi:hypothetical protein